MLVSPILDTVKVRLIDMIPVIVAVHDTDYNIIWANKAYQRATGMPLEEIEGKKCFSIWGLKKPCRGCPVLAAIKSGKQEEAELTPENQDHWPISQGSWLSIATTNVAPDRWGFFSNFQAQGVDLVLKARVRFSSVSVHQ